jgi:hypothetical protein
MNTARLGTALLAGHILVAAISWTMGWITGRLTERRYHDLDWCRPVPVCDLVDLVEPAAAYDWQRDGECVGVAR